MFSSFLPVWIGSRVLLKASKSSMKLELKFSAFLV